ncbi:glutamine synthetase [bacterium]|nr:glutamine synthetase [bacterium]NBX78309.1 glutamine synthetase [bacterium]
MFKQYIFATVLFSLCSITFTQIDTVHTNATCNQRTYKNAPCSIDESTSNLKLFAVTHTINSIHCMFTDLQGTIRTVIFPAHALDDVLDHGYKIDGSSIPGCNSITESDMHVQLDPASYYFAHNTLYIFCTLMINETTPFEADPRWILEQAEKDAHKNNFAFLVGPEIEFFVFTQDGQPVDEQKYISDPIQKDIIAFQEALFTECAEFGIKLDKMHHEVAQGQFEVVLHYNSALKMADTIIMTKKIIKSVAQHFGFIITFMPKPTAGINGSGMHVHFSLYDLENDRNAFGYGNNEYGLSDIGLRSITGILQNISHYALITNSTINSYKRLRPGYEAPVNICWSKTNRSALIRVPLWNKDQQYAARAELRCPDALSNPYLVFAFMLRSALTAIDREVPIMNPVTINLFETTQHEREALEIYSMPGTFEQALHNFVNAPAFMFGLEFHKAYAKIKHDQVKKFYATITSFDNEEFFGL